MAKIGVKKMFSIFEKLFGVGCKHYWELIKVEEITLYEYPHLPVGKKYIITQRCKHCGDIKMKKYNM